MTELAIFILWLHSGGLSNLTDLPPGELGIDRAWLRAMS